MEIAPGRRCVAYNISNSTRCFVQNITYSTPFRLIKYAHDVLISDLDLLYIPEAIFNATTFKFDTHVVRLPFDTGSRFC